MDYVIIVAGGKGLRMGTETPKQFLTVAGKPILMRTIVRISMGLPATVRNCLGVSVPMRSPLPPATMIT